MPEQLKNLYNKVFIENLSSLFKKNHSKFDIKKFEKLVFNRQWKSLELKERMRHITLSLNKVLPTEFEKAVQILLSVKNDYGPSGFEMMIFPDYIECFGTDHWDISINALENLTELASSEFAIRPFLLKDPKKVMKVMLKWSKNKNYHIRRLASEGCRPRLPWAMALPMFKKDPTLIIPILENLKDDPELYVRRSVANNINDISKDHPEVVIKLLKPWKQKESSDIDWVIKHSLRTLEKQGHPDALKILGFSPKPKVMIKNFLTNKKKVKMNESFEFTFDLISTSNQKQNLVIDFIVFLQKANGKRSQKVFKLSKKTIPSHATLNIKKKHIFKEITTRKYYPGLHEIAIQVNGKILKKGEIYLNM